MPSERRWSDADRELVRAVLALHFGSDHLQLDGATGAVLDALTAAGWAPLHRVTCYQVHGKGCHAPGVVTLIYAGQHG